MKKDYQPPTINVYVSENASCVIVNDAQYHGNVTICTGKCENLPATSSAIKEAIETLDREGHLRDGSLWWAIFRVLTMQEFGYPVSKQAFCESIKSLAPTVAHPCKYDNWRRVTPLRLTGSPDHWENLQNLSESEERQRSTALRLLELLRG